VTIVECWRSWIALEIKLWQLDALESNSMLKHAKRCKTVKKVMYARFEYLTMMHTHFTMYMTFWFALWLDL
jgi:hypothetical protein